MFFQPLIFRAESVSFREGIYVQFLGGGFKCFLFLALNGEMIQFCEHIFQMGGSTTNYSINMNYKGCIRGWLWMIIQGPHPKVFPPFSLWQSFWSASIFFSSFVPETTFTKRTPFCPTMPGDVRPVFPRASCIDVWKFKSYEVGGRLGCFPVHQRKFGEQLRWLHPKKKQNTTCLGNIPAERKTLVFFRQFFVSYKVSVGIYPPGN